MLSDFLDRLSNEQPKILFNPEKSPYLSLAQPEHRVGEALNIPAALKASVSEEIEKASGFLRYDRITRTIGRLAVELVLRNDVHRASEESTPIYDQLVREVGDPMTDQQPALIFDNLAAERGNPFATY